jgi:hypothetical protein
MAQLKLAKRKRRHEALAICTGNVKCVLLKNSSGGQLIVHRSTYPQYAGQWQLTTIDRDGRPSGHTNAPTFKEAILRAVNASNDSYWNEHGYSIVQVV